MRFKKMLFIAGLFGALGLINPAFANARLFLQQSDGININSGGNPSTGLMSVRLLDPTDPGYSQTLASNLQSAFGAAYLNCQAKINFNGQKVLTGVVVGSGSNNIVNNLTDCNSLYNGIYGPFTTNSGNLNWTTNSSGNTVCVTLQMENYPVLYTDPTTSGACVTIPQPASPSGIVLVH